MLLESDAVAEAMRRLDYVVPVWPTPNRLTLTGVLADRWLPEGIDHVFFAGHGMALAGHQDATALDQSSRRDAFAVASSRGACPHQAASVEGMDAQGDALGHQNGRLVGVVKGLDAGHHVLLGLWRPTLNDPTFVEHDKGAFDRDGLYHARSVNVIDTRGEVAQARG